MPHIVAVDQSGRVEFTGEDTVLAFSNGIRFTVLLPAVVNRECVRMLREGGFGGPLLYPQLFAVGLYFLLRGHIGDLARITIDLEYFGQDNSIKSHLVNLLLRSRYQIDPDTIEFRQIGKQSGAHKLALSTLQKKVQPDMVLTKEDVLGEFRKPRKEWKKRK
ncbi:MAG TPA: hypothetical protein VEX13_02570 [Chloroflexia bacterium]|nr:hypothetical protein [Chloroflexia bacterium]